MRNELLIMKGILARVTYLEQHNGDTKNIEIRNCHEGYQKHPARVAQLLRKTTPLAQEDIQSKGAMVLRRMMQPKKVWKGELSKVNKLSEKIVFGTREGGRSECWLICDSFDVVSVCV